SSRVFYGTPPAAISTLSLHDALPILLYGFGDLVDRAALDARLRLWSARRLLPDYIALLHYAWGQYPVRTGWASFQDDLRYLSTRSEEHTSELQSRENLVCRLLLEKKK